MALSSTNDDGPQDKSWRSLWLSSGALSLALLGDALIYIVLPVNADLFGVSLAWVGVLLAANRIVRTFSYGALAVLGERIGIRNLCILASVTAVVSTAMYGLFQGWAPLLAARILWGLSYGALLLVALGYAASDRAKTGTRVGVSRAIEQFGPLLALTGGAWLAGILGPRDVFFYLALVSCLAAFLAFMLPPRLSHPPPSAVNRPSALPKPDRLDILIFWMGFGVDGVFTMTVTIMLAEHIALELAMVSGGLIFAGRRVVEMLAAPLSGVIADRLALYRRVRHRACPRRLGDLDPGGGSAVRARRCAATLGPQPDLAGYRRGAGSSWHGLRAWLHKARHPAYYSRSGFPCQPVVASGLTCLARFRKNSHNQKQAGLTLNDRAVF